MSQKTNKKMTDSFLEHVKVVNDDTDEKIQCEKRSEYNKNHKVQVHEHALLPRGLVIDLF